MGLIPKETKFFELFENQTQNAIKAAEFLKDAVKLNKFDEICVKKMKEFEHEGDTITHEIIDKLNETFITPIDREDIHKLASEIDDICDLINVISNRIHIYKIDNVKDPYLEEFLLNIVESATALNNAVKNLKDIKRTRRILEYCIEINRLENAGDSLREKAIMELFEKEKDPIKIIKWKEIYEVAETVLDTCEHVAKTIEEILVKNG
ncbi:MAG: DUF47 domain-containing protein [Elusimicrobia bacterium]|nr:DUF47 domain-containing protein [Elusimicrobiota bacterium]